MSHIRQVRRGASFVIAVASSLLGFVLCAPSAFALIVRPEGAGSSPTASPLPALSTVHTVVTGGMAGWEIALIAVAAAVFTTTLALIADRVRQSQRQVRVSAA